MECASIIIGLQTLTWNNCYFDKFSVNSESTTLNATVTTYGEDIAFVRNEFVSTTLNIFNFIKLNNLVPNNCVDNENLQIYSLSFEQLNLHARSYNINNKILGLYVPKAIENEYGTDTSIILISKQNNYWTKVLFNHELSHYWYDRLCLSSQWSDAEDFALKYEKYYKQLD